MKIHKERESVRFSHRFWPKKIGHDRDLVPQDPLIILQTASACACTFRGVIWQVELTSCHVSSDLKRGRRRRWQVNLTSRTWQVAKFCLFPKHKCRTLCHPIGNRLWWNTIYPTFRLAWERKGSAIWRTPPQNFELGRKAQGSKVSLSLFLSLSFSFSLSLSLSLALSLSRSLSLSLSLSLQFPFLSLSHPLPGLGQWVKQTYSGPAKG